MRGNDGETDDDDGDDIFGISLLSFLVFTVVVGD